MTDMRPGISSLAPMVPASPGNTAWGGRSSTPAAKPTIVLVGHGTAADPLKQMGCAALANGGGIVRDFTGDGRALATPIAKLAEAFESDRPILFLCLSAVSEEADSPASSFERNALHMAAAAPNVIVAILTDSAARLDNVRYLKNGRVCGRVTFFALCGNTTEKSVGDKISKFFPNVSSANIICDGDANRAASSIAACIKQL